MTTEAQAEPAATLPGDFMTPCRATAGAVEMALDIIYGLTNEYWQAINALVDVAPHLKDEVVAYAGRVFEEVRSATHEIAMRAWP